jgi:cytochrome c peroxidase
VRRENALRGNPREAALGHRAARPMKRSAPARHPMLDRAGLRRRGKDVFEGPGKCASCHVPPLFTEPGWNLHRAEEIGIDDFQAQRSPEGRYRTTPLKGLFAHQKGGIYHDGRFATLGDVVAHYDAHLGLGLTPEQQADLVEYLKSL